MAVIECLLLSTKWWVRRGEWGVGKREGSLCAAFGCKERSVYEWLRGSTEGDEKGCFA